jgi:hypothetical protein
LQQVKGATSPGKATVCIQATAVKSKPVVVIVYRNGGYDVQGRVLFCLLPKRPPPNSGPKCAVTGPYALVL